MSFCGYNQALGWVGQSILQCGVPSRHHFSTARALYYNARRGFGTLYYNAQPAPAPLRRRSGPLLQATALPAFAIDWNDCDQGKADLHCSDHRASTTCTPRATPRAEAAPRIVMEGSSGAEAAPRLYRCKTMETKSAWNFFLYLQKRSKLVPFFAR